MSEPADLDPELAAYAAEHGWVVERDNDAGMIGPMRVFALRASKDGEEIAAATWFGVRSQVDAERMLGPALRDFDALLASFSEALGVPERTILTWITRRWLDPTERNLARARQFDAPPLRGEQLTQNELRDLVAGD